MKTRISKSIQKEIISYRWDANIEQRRMDPLFNPDDPDKTIWIQAYPSTWTFQIRHPLTKIQKGKIYKALKLSKEDGERCVSFEVISENFSSKMFKI